MWVEKTMVLSKKCHLAKLSWSLDMVLHLVGGCVSRSQTGDQASPQPGPISVISFTCMAPVGPLPKSSFNS